MTARRAWALLALAAAALAMTPFAGVAASLVAFASCAALVALAALQARDTLKEQRLAGLEKKVAESLTALSVDSERTAQMWRAFKAGE